MKVIVCLFLSLTILGSCKSQDSSNNKAENNTAIDNSGTNNASEMTDNKTQEQKYLAVIYTASSRGVFEYIKISKSETILSEDRYLNNTKTYPTKAEDWGAIVKFIDSTDKDTFKELKAPTDKRLYDGAPHATLSIIEGKEEIITPSFDHGQPPKEILSFVAKVLSIREELIKP